MCQNAQATRHGVSNYPMTWSWVSCQSFNLFSSHMVATVVCTRGAKFGNVTASHIHMTGKLLGTTLCLHPWHKANLKIECFFSQSALEARGSKLPGTWTATEPRSRVLSVAIFTLRGLPRPVGPPCQVPSIQQKESHAPHNWQQVSNAHWNTASWHEW